MSHFDINQHHATETDGHYQHRLKHHAADLQAKLEAAESLVNAVTKERDERHALNGRLAEANVGLINQLKAAEQKVRDAELENKKLAAMDEVLRERIAGWERKDDLVRAAHEAAHEPTP